MDATPKVRFALDSAVEGGGFELLVPLRGRPDRSRYRNLHGRVRVYPADPVLPARRHHREVRRALVESPQKHDDFRRSLISPVNGQALRWLPPIGNPHRR